MSLRDHIFQQLYVIFALFVTDDEKSRRHIVLLQYPKHLRRYIPAWAVIKGQVDDLFGFYLRLSLYDDRPHLGRFVAV